MKVTKELVERCARVAYDTDPRRKLAPHMGVGTWKESASPQTKKVWKNAVRAILREALKPVRG